MASICCRKIDPSILGTLFERGLDPGKRAQLGAHYTDRDKIMLLVEPVVIRPLLTEWVAEKTAITAELERAEAAKSSAARTKRRNEAARRLRAFLERLRRFTVLDPACGSGNFLYLALQELKNLEHRVQLEAAALGFQRAFPEVGPANVKGIELNQWMSGVRRQIRCRHPQRRPLSRRRSLAHCHAAQCTKLDRAGANPDPRLSPQAATAGPPTSPTTTPCANCWRSTVAAELCLRGLQSNAKGRVLFRYWSLRSYVYEARSHGALGTAVDDF